MPESINGWTMPDWSIYDDQALEDMRAWHVNQIEQYQQYDDAQTLGKLSYWRAHVQSIEGELQFRKLAKGDK